jgi:nitroreductase
VSDDSSMMARNAVFAALGTARAVRRFTPDPVPADLVDALVWAATRAASPANDQPWEFVVVDDEPTRAEVGRLVSAAADVHLASFPPTDDPSALRSQRTANRLVRHFGETPVIIFVCQHAVAYPEAYAVTGIGHSGVWMAAANLLVAARSLGLGAAFTFAHQLAGPELPRLLELPEGVEIAATVPVGWPAIEVGPVARKPFREVLHRNRY